MNVVSLSFQTQFHLCHYATCHDEAEFPDAELFIPERWLRAQAPGADCGGTNASYYQHHPYSFIPFGVGVRACVGKRVAEMEMYFALSRVSDGCGFAVFHIEICGRSSTVISSVVLQLMQNYEVQHEDGAPTVEAKTRTLLIPAKPINLRFLCRA